MASNAVASIYGNKVAIFSWQGNSPDAFVIDNKEVADSFRKWFEFMYLKL